MKNLLKLTLSLLALTGTLYVGGCTGETPSEEPPVVVPVFDGVTSMRVQEKLLPLFVGETADLHVDTFPRVLRAKAVFSVADTSIATVSEEGVVTAVAAGQTTLTVCNSDGAVTKEIPIVVSEANLKTSTKRSTLINNITKKQKSDGLANVDKVRIYENSDELRFLNGTQIRHINEDQEMVISKSDAFFAIYGYDKEVKCSDGSVTIQDWGWIMYTNEYFDTYCFHIDGYTKNYCVVSTTSFVEKEGGRWAALCGVLDNLFISGHGIMTNYMEYSVGADVLSAGNASGTTKAGSLGDGNFMYTYGEAGTDTVTAKEEDDIDIPAGTPGAYVFKLKMYYDQYIAQYREMTSDYDYTLEDGNIISTKTHRRMTFDHSLTEIEYPNKDNYSKVDTFMDL